MNRKMRANLNNKIARAKKERSPQKVCNRCGGDEKDHVPVVVLGVAYPFPDKEETRPPGVTLQ